MEKDFDRWSGFKKYIDADMHPVDFRERDIWWCSVGVNVGREQQSQTRDFSRPILVIKRFTPDIFWAVPLTTKIKEDGFRVCLRIGEVDNDALVLHMRSYDRKRLLRKICKLPDGDFKKVTDLIVSAVSQENEIPLAGEISEPEGNVPISLAKEALLSTDS